MIFFWSRASTCSVHPPLEKQISVSVTSKNNCDDVRLSRKNKYFLFITSVIRSLQFFCILHKNYYRHKLPATCKQKLHHLLTDSTCRCYLRMTTYRSALTHLRYSSIKESNNNSYFSSKCSEHTKEVQLNGQGLLLEMSHVKPSRPLTADQV